MRLHQDIDIAARDVKIPFLSGWTTAHPITYSYMGEKAKYAPNAKLANEYQFLSDDDELKSKISMFHKRVDGEDVALDRIFIGSGSSPLISAIMMALRNMDVTELHYFKPIYHSYYVLAEGFGYAMNPVGDNLYPDLADNFLEALPEQRSALLVTDPCWISGRSLDEAFWKGIGDWQTRTGSIVIVDGTFQYTQWHGMKAEASSLLDPAHTIRLVCPTKSLCIHGTRFAYLLLPQNLRESIGWVYCKLVSGNSGADMVQANQMMDQLNSTENNRPLVAVIQSQFEGLVKSNNITELLSQPNCSYYAFGTPGKLMPQTMLMSGQYFESSCDEKWKRINLLSPDLPSELMDPI